MTENEALAAWLSSPEGRFGCRSMVREPIVQAFVAGFAAGRKIERDEQ